MKRTTLAVYLLAALSASGCQAISGMSELEYDRVCDPGTLGDCPCDSGKTAGKQTCKDNGMAWGQCDCSLDRDATTDGPKDAKSEGSAGSAGADARIDSAEDTGEADGDGSAGLGGGTGSDASEDGSLEADGSGGGEDSSAGGSAGQDGSAGGTAGSGGTSEDSSAGDRLELIRA